MSTLAEIEARRANEHAPAPPTRADAGWFVRPARWRRVEVGHVVEGREQPLPPGVIIASLQERDETEMMPDDETLALAFPEAGPARRKALAAAWLGYLGSLPDTTKGYPPDKVGQYTPDQL